MDSYRKKINYEQLLVSGWSTHYISWRRFRKKPQRHSFERKPRQFWHISLCMHAYLCACPCVRACVCECTKSEMMMMMMISVCVYVCVSVCMCVCMRACVRVCVYIYIYPFDYKQAMSCVADNRPLFLFPFPEMCSQLWVVKTFCQSRPGLAVGN